MRLAYAIVAAVLGACNGAPDEPVICDPPRGPAWGRFADVTGESGIDFRYASTDFKGGALAVADLDNDGLPDIVAGRRVGGTKVFRNRGAMRFAEITASGIPSDARASAIAVADFDNDDDRDVILASKDLATVFANQGDGTFVEVLALRDTGATEHLLPVDVDGDGLLDLYVGNYDSKSRDDTANQLYLNRGGLQFALAGTFGGGLTWTTTAFDFDADGDQDLYVANDTLGPDFGAGPIAPAPFPVDHFLRNDGIGPDGLPQFTDIAASLGLTEPRSSMSGLLGDFDDNGLLDLFVTNWGAKKLFLRGQDGGFTEGAAMHGLSGIARVNEGCDLATDNANCLVLSWAAALADFDLDGHDEVVIVNGETQIGTPPPPVLFYKRGPAAIYSEVASDLPCQDTRGMIVTDLDNDGDPDIVTAPKAAALSIYENREPAAGKALRLQLRGQASNRDGVGAQVTLRLASGRVLTRVVGSGGVLHSSGPAEAVFGLGDDRVSELEIRWPSGRRDLTTSPPHATTLLVEELLVD